MMNINQDRNSYWQMVRGILIVMVLLIHCSSGMLLDQDSFNFNYWIVFRNAINFPVATFIFIAGYFAKSEINKNRLFKLVMPFLIWSCIYSIMSALHHTGDLNFLRICAKIFYGKAAAPLYFILVLIQLTLITPYLLKFIKQKKNNWLMLSITPIYMLALYAKVKMGGTQPFLYETFFPAWFIFYYGGLYYKIYGVNYTSFFIKYAEAIFVLTFVLEISEAYLLMGADWPRGFIVSQIKFSSFAYAMSAICLLFKWKRFVSSDNWLKFVGDRSYGI